MNGAHKMSEKSIKLKTGRSGQRGVKEVDPTLDHDLFIDEYLDKDGKKVRVGHFRISHEINNELKKQALSLKVSKSELVRQILESFVKFYNESKQLGGARFFEAKKTIHDWISERNNFMILMKEMNAKNTIIQQQSKSPEVKLLSQQLLMLAQLIKLTNKNII